MFEGPYALAVAAGMAATVNPCGFALLPAYLSSFLGAQHRHGGANAVGRALAVTAALTAGFVVVFGVFGIVVTPLALSVEDELPWVTIVIGAAVTVAGVALLAGRQLNVRIPKLQAGGRDGSLVSMFLFGISYATASLSCTIGPFLAVTTSTFRSSSWIAGGGVFLAYAAGMGVVIGALTVALSIANASLVRRFRAAMRSINRVAGGLMIVAGLYVAYYGWYEIRARDGNADDPIIDRATHIQTWLQHRIVPDDPAAGAATAAGGLAAATIAATLLHRRRATTHTTNGHQATPDNDSTHHRLAVPSTGWIDRP